MCAAYREGMLEYMERAICRWLLNAQGLRKSPDGFVHCLVYACNYLVSFIVIMRFKLEKIIQITA